MNADGQPSGDSATGNLDHLSPKCPRCGSLLYSQKSRLCGQCGAGLPPEMVLTDEKAAARTAQRAWARDLAGKFDTTGRRSEPEPPLSARARYEAAEASPEELLRPISCATEFKHRKRPWVWLIILGELFGLWVIAVMFESLSMALGWRWWLFCFALLAVGGFVHWLNSSPICPNCRQNIRTCRAEHCHVCGERLRHKRCADCGVDHSWTGWFRPHANGRYQWIKHCPGCGVELDTCIRRWRAGN